MDAPRNSKVFVPYSDGLAERLAPLGELVPFQLDYPCLRTTTFTGPEDPADDAASPRPRVPEDERLTG
jgi:hypothetical protein